MEIVGNVTKLIEKQNIQNHRTKIIAQINDAFEDKNVFEIEFRSKDMYAASKMLKEGDNVRVNVFFNGRIDKYGNHYNNIIAEEIVKL
jgi:translation initiation factor IF-3